MQGYAWLPPQQHDSARDSQNQVILRDIFIAAIQRINAIPLETARAAYQDMLTVADNETWLSYLRSNYSRNVPGKTTKRTISLVDFLNPQNNTFTVIDQFYIKFQKPRKSDTVTFLNGIPIVVIGAKKPFAYKDKLGEAFDQIKQYERDIPRLFYSNLFNLITDGVRILYGATSAPSNDWADWKDPYPAFV